MQNGTICPKAHELASLASGELSDAEADTLCEHVQSCTECTKFLGQMPDDEYLLGCARQRSTYSAPPEDQESIHFLIARLRYLPRQTTDDGVFSNANDSGLLVDSLRTEIQNQDGLKCLLKSLQSPGEGQSNARVFGDYRVLSVLGSGGMGIVVEAEELRLQRKVAIKFVHPRLLDKHSIHRRFLTEGRAAALLQHDHIVSIYHVGEIQGVPYLVMPLLRGETLETRLRREGALPILDTIRIGKQIALGLSAAHLRGVVHRDIKPANIWLEEIEHDLHGTVEMLPRVKILDFGLARNDEEDLQLTEPGAIAGTPAYMSPEQAMGEKVSTRSDLFSLGCVLYFSCSGRCPFIGRNSIATMLSVLENKPIPLKQLNPDVPEALAALVARLLQKDPSRRFGTADQVAEALKAMEVNGAKEQKSYRRWGGRGIGILAAIGTVLLFVLFSFLGGLIFKVETSEGTIVLEMDSTTAEGAEILVDDHQAITIRLKDDKETMSIRTTPGKHTLRVNKAGFELFTKEFSLMAGDSEKVRVHLEPHSKSAPSFPAPAVPKLQSRTNGKTIELPGLVWKPKSRTGLRGWQLETRMPRGEVHSIAWNSKMDSIACGSSNGYVRVLGVNRSELQHLFPAHSGAVNSLDWNSVTEQWVTAGEDGAVCLFDSNGKRQHEIATESGALHAVAASPDGKWIAAATSDHTIKTWSNTGEAGPVFRGPTAQISSIAWNPASRKLASSSWDGTVRIWKVQAETWDEVDDAKVIHLGNRAMGVAWNPDGNQLAIADSEGGIHLWSADGKDNLTWKGHSTCVTAIAWCSGERLTTGDQDGNVNLWQGRELLKSNALGPGKIEKMTWTRDGSKLAVASDGRIRFFDSKGESIGAIAHDTSPVRSVAWHGNERIATAGEDRSVRIWDKDGLQRTFLPGHTSRAFSVSWNRVGDKLVSAGWDQRVRVWDIASDNVQLLQGHDPASFSPAEDLIAWSRGNAIALGSVDQPMSALEGHRGTILAIAWNATGNQFATSDGAGEIRIWNRDGSLAASMRSELGIVALRWHPTLPILASAGIANGNISLWQEDGRLRSSWCAHKHGIQCLAWSPDGERILSSSISEPIGVWRLDGSSVRSFGYDTIATSAIDWEQKSNRIATAHNDGTFRIWDGDTFDVLSQSILFNDGNWVCVDAAGKIHSDDPSVLDRLLVRLVVDDNGEIRLEQPSGE